MSEISKEYIIEMFNNNIKGKLYIKNKEDKNSDEGHWLEKMMNIKPNSSIDADIGGYEMKKNSKKITFGDWSGEYLFSNNINLLNKYNNSDLSMSKEKFIKTFGNQNIKKNRYSWSGKCIPKYGKWNDCGQMLIIKDEHIMALYSYNNDKRTTKEKEFENKEIYIAIWNKDKMKNHIEKKFNQNGFFICNKNKKNIYDKICFGKQINYELFLEKIRTNEIYLDSGLFHDENKNNNRLYSQWRANYNFWNDLIIEVIE